VRGAVETHSGLCAETRPVTRTAPSSLLCSTRSPEPMTLGAVVLRAIIVPIMLPQLVETGKDQPRSRTESVQPQQNTTITNHLAGGWGSSWSDVSDLQRLTQG